MPMIQTLLLATYRTALHVPSNFSYADSKNKRAELKRNINRAPSPFIRMIPPEIITIISEFANTDFTHPLLYDSRLSAATGGELVGTQQLWPSIKIDLPNDMARSEFLRLELLIETWLSRSGQLPLHNSLSAYQNTRAKVSAKCSRFLNHYSFRWYTLNMSIHSNLLSRLRPDRRSFLPHLEILNTPKHFAVR